MPVLCNSCSKAVQSYMSLLEMLTHVTGLKVNIGVRDSAATCVPPKNHKQGGHKDQVPPTIHRVYSFTSSTPSRAHTASSRRRTRSVLPHGSLPSLHTFSSIRTGKSRGLSSFTLSLLSLLRFIAWSRLRTSVRACA